MRSRLSLAILAALACVLSGAVSAMAQGGEFVSAEWGVRGNRVDVTPRVRSLMRNGVLNFQVTRFVLGIDPDPHQVKDLLIRVRRWDGQIEDYDFLEKGMVNLQLDPDDGYRQSEERRRDRDDDDGYRDRDRYRDRDHDRDGVYDRHEPRLRIVRAYYGAEGQFVDVTDSLRSQMNDGRLFIRVDNRSMGVDPLPGHRKWLRVLYFSDGERKSVVVEEKTDLQLP
jgi:DnaJ-like protein